MTNNTLASICRSRNVSIAQLAALLDEKPQDIVCASQGGAGFAPLCQRIAEVLGASCWEDLLHEKRTATQAQKTRRLNMRRLVVLPDAEITVLTRAPNTRVFEYDGAFYVDSLRKGKLVKRSQFFDRIDAHVEYTCEAAKYL